MTNLQLVPFDKASGRSHPFPAPGTSDTPMIHALLVGAGFSMAVHPTALSWGDLIRGLSKRLGGGDPTTEHWFVEGLRLSRQHSPRKRDAVATRFQLAVRDLITGTCKQPTSTDKQWKALCKAFRQFVTATKCSVILDTNYDATMEWLLEGANIPYTRLIGSEATSVCPLPEDAVVLWKIHGTADAPATIVLSPTEYQRIYESNALGDVLQSLGRRIDCLWVMGCGLGDDETWTYLCTESGPRQIACLWQNRLTACPAGVPADWESQVTNGNRSVKVYWAPLLDTPVFRSQGRQRTADQLQHIASTVTGLSGYSAKSSQKHWWDSRNEAFDCDYLAVLKTGNVAAALALVDGAQQDFERLRNFLLSQQRGGMGNTWCASVPENLKLDRKTRDMLAADFRRVAEMAVHWCTTSNSILVSAAAQAAVGYVVELAEILGVSVTVNMKAASRTTLGANQRVLVGTNPFFVRPGQAHRANLMNFHTTRESLAIEYPLAGQPYRPPRSGTLMDENDWEARVIHAYRVSNPCLVFGDCNPLPVTDLPPLYPWGFRLRDIQSFRENNDSGTVSKRWHLVSNVEGGWQICKGGGLRDRGRIAFRIGNRGRVRIGEHDDFIEPAFR